jgi:hypothetical protein
MSAGPGRFAFHLNDDVVAAGGHILPEPLVRLVQLILDDDLGEMEQSVQLAFLAN